MITFNRTKHKSMWEWIAEQIESEDYTSVSALKAAWPGWEKNEAQPCNNCFACEAATAFAKELRVLDCVCRNACPLIWEDPSGQKIPSCLYRTSIFFLIDFAVFTRKERAALAIRIAYLPLNKVWTDELARDPARVQVI